MSCRFDSETVYSRFTLTGPEVPLDKSVIPKKMLQYPHPTRRVKQVGRFYSQKELIKIAKEKGWEINPGRVAKTATFLRVKRASDLSRSLCLPHHLHDRRRRLEGPFPGCRQLFHRCGYAGTGDRGGSICP